MKEHLMIRRFRCQNCHSYHNELPDCLVPYKHYEAEVIAGVLDEVILPDDLDSEDYPSFSTMLRWLQWFRENLQRIEGYLRTVRYQILHLEKETLEEFRFLLNYRFDSMSPMAVVLVGQTELWENKLKLQRYAAIRQRIDMYCILPHLDRSETEQYIASHMDYSGCAQEVFTTKALDEIHKASAGIPRMINRICEKALMYAFQNQKRLIDDYMIKYVVEHEMLGSIAP